VKINFNNIKFVRKDKTLLDNPYKTIMEHDKTGYVYVDNVEGVAVIPYRMGANGREILIRDEYSPLHNTVLSIITGRRDKDDKNGQAAARRELLEEAGILAEERWFNEVGEILPAGSYKRADVMYVVDVTGVHQGRPETDGSIFEKKSTNMWVPVSELARMVREPNGATDAYFLSAVAKYLVWCGLFKSEESDLAKDKKGSERPGHKYIRREGQAGGYKYIYKEPEQKTAKKEDEKKPKGGIMEQLAALLGKKQGGEEKKPKKQLPFKEFPMAPEGMPDFKKGVTAAQWIATLDSMVTRTTSDFMANLDDGDHFLMSEPLRRGHLYADAVISMLDAARNAYSTQDLHSKDILVEDKKRLSDGAQGEVQRGILKASYCLCATKHMTAALNSSLTERVFSNLAEKLDAGASYNKTDKLVTIVASVKNQLEDLSGIMKDIRWLQGGDPKLDWMVDSVFKAVDELMQARNRFVTNGFKFYIDKLAPKIESLADAEEIDDSVKLLEGLETFRHEAMYSSTTSHENETFANQWNMKQKGIYDGASRFSAYASGKLVDKVKGLEDLGDDKILQGHINELAKSPAFAFLSMSKHVSSFQVSEQIFSYIDTHGIDKYYKDMVYLTGGRSKPWKGAKTDHYEQYVKILTEAYNGNDVYENEDMKDIASFSGDQMGNMVKSHPASTVYAAMNTMLLLNKKTPITSRAPAFIRMWSVASHNSLMSNALEEFVSAKNIDRGSYVNYHIASNRTVTPRRTSVKEGLAHSANEIYAYSQELINSSDEIKGDTVKLYRGNGSSEVKSVASSWTPRDDVAAHFGSEISVVDAPKESVFLFNDMMNEDYWTFPHEREFILMPGLLSADKKLNPEALAPSARQSILDKQLEQQAEAYGEKY
jgi:8-oxo-dGTP pyrophosphatase MutT (NUDIX family)